MILRQIMSHIKIPKIKTDKYKVKEITSLIGHFPTAIKHKSFTRHLKYTLRVIKMK